MYLIFFDESKQQKDYPFYHLGGICIHENDLKGIESEVNDLSQFVFGNFILQKENEFHANDIYHKRNHFKEILHLDDRVDILISLLKILSKDSIKLIDIRINLENLYNSKRAPDYAFMFLCEKADSLMSDFDSLGMLIGDRENDVEASRFSTALSNYRGFGTKYVLKKEINNLFESVHFTQSHLSRFLQLADIYTWICQYKNKYKSNKNNERHIKIFKRLEEVNILPKRYKVWPQTKQFF